MTTKDIKYTLSVNVFEMGVLMSLIMQADKHTRNSLPDTWQQLVATKKQIERGMRGEEGIPPRWQVKNHRCRRQRDNSPAVFLGSGR